MGNTFIIEIHISNPQNYEIQSFTLNGTKYVDYMFEPGSTMECLLLAVDAPKTPGYTEYTIDAIKYIDGTEIKDVDMSSGDKKITVGVSYKDITSTARVNSQSISSTSAEFNIKVLAHPTFTDETEIYVYLSDGQTVIDSQPLKVGDNTVQFSGLDKLSTYEYGVVAKTDLINGSGLSPYWLLTRTFKTTDVFELTGTVTSKTSIAFEVKQFGSNGTVQSFSLYDATTNDLVATVDADQREFHNIFAGKVYDLYMDYTYTSGDKEIADRVMIQGLTTDPIAMPSFKLDDFETTQTGITGSYTVTDPDGAVTDITVELYKDGKLVQTNADSKIAFSGLEPYSEYRVKFIFTYDLKNGKAPTSLTKYEDVKTIPTFSINSVSLASSKDVHYGETVTLQINVFNPYDIHCMSVVINGKKYSADQDSFDPSIIYCDIVNDGSLGSVDMTLTVERIELLYDGSPWIDAQTNNTAKVHFYSKFEVKSLDYVTPEKGKYVAKNYFFPSEKVYLMLTLNNKDGYTIDYLRSGDDRIYSLTKVDDEHYIVFTDEELRQQSGMAQYTLWGISYSRGGFQNDITVNFSAKTCLLESDTVHYVSTAQELNNMSNAFCYYELKNDIDLAGFDWQIKDFCGVLNGKGYSVKNFTFDGVLTYELYCVGLFSVHTGVVCNLNMVGAKIDVRYDTMENGHIGCIAGYAGILQNCTVDQTSYIHAECGYVGGLAGTGDIFVNCTNSATVTGKNYVGGISGHDGRFKYCANYGIVTGEKYVGGISGANGMFDSCAHYGEVYGNSAVGGISGGTDNYYDNSEFRNCINCGSISSESSLVGAISGGGKGDVLIGCCNYQRHSLNGAGLVFAPHGYMATITNCHEIYNLGTEERAQYNSKSFYTDTLGWDASVWNLDDLDIEIGMYPTLK